MKRFNWLGYRGLIIPLIILTLFFAGFAFGKIKGHQQGYEQGLAEREVVIDTVEYLIDPRVDFYFTDAKAVNLGTAWSKGYKKALERMPLRTAHLDGWSTALLFYESIEGLENKDNPHEDTTWFLTRSLNKVFVTHPKVEPLKTIGLYPSLDSIADVNYERGLAKNKRRVANLKLACENFIVSNEILFELLDECQNEPIAPGRQGDI